MKKIRLLQYIIIFMFLNLQLCAETGESGVAVLMLDSYGAREMALGDTFVGIADNINTISVNPAGLNTLHSTEISLMYLKYPLDITFSHLAFGTKLSKNIYSGYLAASCSLFYLPGFDEYDSAGNKSDNALSASDIVFTIGYANNILKLFNLDFNLHTGINVKYIKSKIVEDAGDAFSIDIGVLYKIDFVSLEKSGLQGTFGIGMSVQNLGTSIKYGKEDTKLPRNFKIGISYNLNCYNKHNILVGMDFNKPNDSNNITSVGMEYSFINMIFGRIGYKIIERESDNISFGIGGKYKIGKRQIGFDYTIIPLHDLGTKHAFSLSVNF